jgi:hypothetical protein
VMKQDRRRGFKPEISLRMKQMHKSRKELEKLYYELLYAVERKFENESRHETALRYIREAEFNANQHGPVTEK